MTYEEARTHLHQRVKTLEGRYVDHFPKWTVGDLVAVSILLRPKPVIVSLKQEMRGETQPVEDFWVKEE